VVAADSNAQETVDSDGIATVDSVGLALVDSDMMMTVSMGVTVDGNLNMLMVVNSAIEVAVGGARSGEIMVIDSDIMSAIALEMVPVLVSYSWTLTIPTLKADTALLLYTLSLSSVNLPVHMCMY
jgi:hypothetical protein